MNDELFAPLARIILRYVGGALIAKGVLHIDPAMLVDADVVQIFTVLLGAVCSFSAEFWWYVARKHGKRHE